jgi:hypothetical protein
MTSAIIKTHEADVADYANENVPRQQGVRHAA